MTNVSVKFMDGEELQQPVLEGQLVKGLIVALNEAKPPPVGARLRLMMDERVLLENEPAASLAGCALVAIYGSSEYSYLVMKDDALVLLDEGIEGWSEDVGAKASIKEESWVPAPSVEEGTVVNYAKECDGASVTATSNIFGVPEKLRNVIRLGSKFGDPRFVHVGGDSSFIFGGGDTNPALNVDLGRSVTLVRVGSICYSDRWLNFFEVKTSATDAELDEELWDVWGSDKTSRPQTGVVFFDRPPTVARHIRIRAKSGHCPGARIGPIFAYGIV